MELYYYMVSLLLEGFDWYQVVNKAQTGANMCCFADFILWVWAKRMSGEMCTSVGNGFTNWAIHKYFEKKKNWKSLRCAVEGDDGVFSFYGEPPTEQEYAQFGLVVKLMVVENITEGSFCGIICDEEDFINVTDPIKALLKFGWTTRQYLNAKEKKLMGLLRAKSLSMLYQYQSCPILHALAAYGERITRGYKWILPTRVNTYEINRMLYLIKQLGNKLPERKTGIRTRLLVERRFGVTVDDQIQIEKYFDEKQEPGIIDCPLVLRYCPKDSLHFAQRYVYPVHEGFGSILGRNYQLSNKTSSFVKYAKTTK